MTFLFLLINFVILFLFKREQQLENSISDYKKTLDENMIHKTTRYTNPSCYTGKALGQISGENNTTN